MPFSPHPGRQLLFLVFLITDILTDVKWYLTAVLICISLTINDIDHIFLLVIHIFSLEKCLLTEKCQFFIGLFVFFISSSMISLWFLIFISLIINNVEHLFKCLFAICMYLWKEIYSGFLFWNWVFFLYQVLWDICIFWILIPYQIHPLQIICPISVGDLFILLSFLVWKHLFWCSLICLFLFVFSLIEDIYPKNIAETDVKEQITYVF